MISVILSLNILVTHASKIIYFLSSPNLDMLITSISTITIGTGMLGTIFGIEIVRIKKNFSFH